MTPREAISICDRLRPNAYSFAEKELWLRELEARIGEELVNTHEGGEDFLSGRTEEHDDAPLYVAIPHESLYLYYLLARIDQMNGETARYNESAAMFNAQYESYCAWYNRTHRPKGTHVDVKEDA